MCTWLRLITRLILLSTLCHLQHQIIQHNQRAGVIVSSGDLALQGITRHQAGNYTCTASNVEGDGDSNIVELKVMCKYSEHTQHTRNNTQQTLSGISGILLPSIMHENEGARSISFRFRVGFMGHVLFLVQKKLMASHHAAYAQHLKLLFHSLFHMCRFTWPSWHHKRLPERLSLS